MPKSRAQIHAEVQLLKLQWCRPTSTAPVGWSTTPKFYATRSGATFHSDPDCSALRFGWARVIDEGGHPSRLQQLTKTQVAQRRLAACQRCGSLC